MVRSPCVLAPFALAIACGALSAQDSTSTTVSCDGKIVSAIQVTPQDPSFLKVPRSVRALARAVGVLHTTTRAKTIGSFLLLEVGQPCTERRRSESERILRLQPFLAEATVRAVPDGAGGVRIEVETADEIPTVFAMRLHGMSPSALRFGNGNVGGQGLYLAAKVERGFAYRTGVGVYGVAHQVFGRPYTAALTAERICPGTAAWFLYAHTSAEPGHARLLAALDAKPLLNLGLRLGEGSGAAVAVPLLRMACALHGGMATFAEAGVSNRD